MIPTNKDKLKEFENNYNFRLVKKLPLAIIINGRSFKKTTSIIEKPYDVLLSEILGATMIKLSSEVDGTVFAYSFNDEIILISRNDQFEETQLWYDGNLQKICSATSSIATSVFSNYALRNNINLVGDPTFTSQVFVLPNIDEVVNMLIFKQQQSLYTSVFFSCFFNLAKKYDPSMVLDTLKNLTLDEKIDLLKEEFKIDYRQYPSSFRRGIACYRTPKLINSNGQEEIRYKLSINTNLPDFAKNSEWLYDILDEKEIIRLENV